MARSVPTVRSLPLWPRRWLAALVPLLAAHLAWALSLRADLIPASNSYWDGCVSISRAARHGLGNHLFRLEMRPCAAVQVLFWLAAAHLLRRDTGNPGAWFPWLGLVCASFLVLYFAFPSTR